MKYLYCQSRFEFFELKSMASRLSALLSSLMHYIPSILPRFALESDAAETTFSDARVHVAADHHRIAGKAAHGTAQPAGHLGHASASAMKHKSLAPYVRGSVGLPIKWSHSIRSSDNSGRLTKPFDRMRSDTEFLKPAQKVQHSVALVQPVLKMSYVFARSPL